jgi:hypothetical protein
VIVRTAEASARRIERGAAIACLGMAAVALVARGGRPDVALGVLGGGALAGASYWAIKAAVHLVASAVTSVPGRARRGRGEEIRAARGRKTVLAWGLALLVLRYALLGLAAYAMIARLRLHPLGLLVGASSVVAAAAAEAIRTART